MAIENRPWHWLADPLLMFLYTRLPCKPACPSSFIKMMVFPCKHRPPQRLLHCLLHLHLLRLWLVSKPERACLLHGPLGRELSFFSFQIHSDSTNVFFMVTFCFCLIAFLFLRPCGSGWDYIMLFVICFSSFFFFFCAADSSLTS